MAAISDPDPDFPPAHEGWRAEVRGLALLGRFLLELTLLFAVGWSVWAATGGRAWSWGLAAAGVTAVGVAWGAWLSPRAPHRPAEPVRVLIEALLFGGVGGCLWALGHPVLGVLLVVLWLLDRVVLAELRPQ